MGRYLKVTYDNGYGSITCESDMDEGRRQNLQLDQFNEFNGTCRKLINDINTYLFTAETAHDFEILEILCFIVKECKECECKFISIYNY